MPKKETTIQVNGADLPVEIYRRKGSRHLRMSLGTKNQLRVSVPWHCSERAVWKFVEQQRTWIEKRLALTPHSLAVSEWLLRHSEVSTNGQVFQARIERSEEVRRGRYRFAKDSDLVSFELPADADEGSVLALVRSFARDTLQCRLLYQTQRLELELPPLSVRDQASRWGSCSSSGRISLNWRLVLVAPELQDYVILHELAHLTELNHSARFWSLLDQYDPDRRSHEKALDDCSSAIMRVGR